AGKGPGSQSSRAASGKEPRLSQRGKRTDALTAAHLSRLDFGLEASAKLLCQLNQKRKRDAE
ncbi:MAG: hypothetical protein JWN34_4474, partial [Bryobacterales bacterium]|nr:hypothetical protein [Bryobacterales bacterium]